MSNAYYWEGKQKRAEEAKKHTQEMAEKYPEMISYSVDHTVCSPAIPDTVKDAGCKTGFILRPVGTVDAICHLLGHE